MKRRSRIILTCILAFAGVRVLAGLLLILASRQSGEAVLLVLLDVPTLAVYWVLAQMGVEWGVGDASDARFWGVALVVWAFLGLIAGLVVARFRPATAPAV